MGHYSYGPETPMTWRFDPKLNKWEETIEEDSLPSATDGRSIFEYDPVNEVCLLLSVKQSSSPAEKDIWAYDVKNKKWSNYKLPEDNPIEKLVGMMGYYDRKYNVMVVFSRTLGKKVWIYKFKK